VARQLFDELKKLGPKGLIILAIAIVVVLAIAFFVAVWAPADLIIEDASASFTTLDLAALTSPNFPPPPVVEFTSAGDIKVKIEPVNKGAAQYRERRLLLRYNRVS
jgi:hypothetical protein